MRTQNLSLQVAIALFVISGATIRADVVESDICVYGGTSAGVMAAVEAKRMGKTVTLVEPYQHLGGMTSSGLGATDIGERLSVGGLTLEFYHRLALYYANDAVWTRESKGDYFTKHANHLSKQSDLSSTDGLMLTFEPHVAETTFNAMIKEAGVEVHLGQKLATVTKDGAKITEITMENGNVFRAREFIDATYEGDLMAKARVSYTVGREANATYDETLNGIRPPLHMFKVAVDPYLTVGNPSSGLLPLIQPEPFGTVGGADQSIQAYNYRLCLTKDPSNKIEIAPPADYHPETYELLARYFEAMASAGKNAGGIPCWAVPMPNLKVDFNNSGVVSTDFVGMSKDFPEADFTAREKIAKAHEDYIRGWFYFLQTSSRVPKNIRDEAAKWGLCRDEFQDTSGWPHQLYIREARRMIADFVMTERNCLQENGRVKDSIGLASYGIDCHSCRRLLLDGKVENEGLIGVGSSLLPFPIAYRAIVPKAQECTNLLVPVCLSASHVAYAPIRMEPVYMILGQSSGTAAVLSLDDNVGVQQLRYDELRDRLLKDGQILQGHWTPDKN